MVCPVHLRMLEVEEKIKIPSSVTLSQAEAEASDDSDERTSDAEKSAWKPKELGR